MPLEIRDDPPSIRIDGGGAVRVGNTRLTLVILVQAFRSGLSPEQIAEQFNMSSLADVYSAIGYYLRHQDEIDAFVREAEQYADELKRKIEAGYDRDEFRERLLARRRAKQVNV
jgi:uncharacterized protein (DUF433 family)